MNPTPSNWSLQDSDGEWIIGEQGGYQAEAPDDLNLRPSEWVETNVHYGYGCICITTTTDRAIMTVRRIVSAASLPLRRCRTDPALRGWERQLRGG